MPGPRVASSAPRVQQPSTDFGHNREKHQFCVGTPRYPFSTQDAPALSPMPLPRCDAVTFTQILLLLLKTRSLSLSFGIQTALDDGIFLQNIFTARPSTASQLDGPIRFAAQCIRMAAAAETS